MNSAATALLAQRLLALPFGVLGAWCLAAPGMVESLTVRPEHQHNSETTAILIGCFGAQALLNALFILSSKFTRRTFFAYGVALSPFFAFNYYFIFVRPIFNQWLAIDFVANLFMLALCVIGWRAAPPDGALASLVKSR